jgi:hypothetical protein
MNPRDGCGSRAAIALCASLLAAGGAAPLARAEPGGSATATARAEALLLWDEARSVWQQGDLEQAERLLRQSFERSPSGQAACDLGRVLRERTLDEEAADWLDRCAAQPDTDAGAGAQASAEARTLRDRAGRLRVLGGGAGAALMIDGIGQGRLPLERELTLVPGSHEVVVIAPDGVSTRRTVEVVPAELTSVDLRVQAASRPAAVASQRRVPRWAVWMMAGVALAATVASLATYGLDFRYSSEPGAEAEQQADLMRLVSAVLGGVAGTSLGVTLVLIPYSVARHPRGREIVDPGPRASGSSGRVR